MKTAGQVRLSPPRGGRPMWSTVSSDGHKCTKVGGQWNENKEQMLPVQRGWWWECRTNEKGTCPEFTELYRQVPAAMLNTGHGRATTWTPCEFGIKDLIKGK